MYKPFQSYAIDLRNNDPEQVIPVQKAIVPLGEVVMCIYYEPKCIFITKAQAMEFFGLVDAPAPYVEPTPKCACCGTTENLWRDYGSGGPYRCNSSECVVF